MDYKPIIELAVEIIVILLAGLVLPKLRALLKASLSAEEYDTLEKLIIALVKAAEQTLKEDDPTGQLRKNYVVTQLAALNYEMTEQINAMIEAAVYGVNNGSV